MLALHGVTYRTVMPGRQDDVTKLSWDDYATLHSAISSVARWKPEALDDVFDGDTDACKSGWAVNECLRGLGIVSGP